ncbi:hypothetical protein NLI96_g9472 [Meripilus lineatus]|uniref:Formyl transferase C-terminal domain-containing protein n=1 Tax=Meripilus lineatus TaxID=2056292 RepID=A0AAD5YAY4_9APHY|nr:hypothetical protein NLI96_g9472 [Physisporinus lineatus]
MATNLGLPVHTVPSSKGRLKPFQHALLDNQAETGVSVLEMQEFEKGVDAGPIFGQTRHAIPPMADFRQLRHDLAVKGGDLLVDVLRQMLAGKATSEPQPSDSTTPEARHIEFEDSLADFSAMTAEEISRRYRAVWPKNTRCYLNNGHTIQLYAPVYLESAPEGILSLLSSPGLATYDDSSSGLLVRCANDTILRVPQVKARYTKVISAQEWWDSVKPEQRVENNNISPVVLFSRRVQKTN